MAPRRPVPPRHYEGLSHGRMYNLIRQRRPLLLTNPDNQRAYQAYVDGLYSDVFTTRRKSTVFEKIANLPELTAAFDHPDLRDMCITQGKSLLQNMGEPQACELIRSFVESNMWMEDPVQTSLFLSWLFACVPQKLMADEVGLRLLGVMAGAERSGLLLSHMLQSMPDIAYTLLERHQRSGATQRIDETKTLNLDDLRLFAVMQVQPKYRPYDLRDGQKVPPPIFPDNFGLSCAALSSYALLPRRWMEAEQRLDIVTAKRDHRRRTRIRLSVEGYTETVRYVRGENKGNGPRHVSFEVWRPSPQVSALRNGRAAADDSIARASRKDPA
jgi:hypothetical protein